MWDEATNLSGNSKDNLSSLIENMERQLELYEIKLNVLAFEQQSLFACFYSFVKLKEYETRNLFWISECIEGNYKQQIDSKRYPIFQKKSN